MDGDACWLEDSKENILLYSRALSKAKVKINSKIIDLKSKETFTSKAFMECGKTYHFNSSDEITKVKVVLNKNNSKDCYAQIDITNSKDKIVLKKLKLVCSH